MDEKIGQTVDFNAEVERRSGIGDDIGFKGFYEIECFDKDGNLKWVETISNLVMNVGLDEVLDKFWKGSAYTAAHYVGLLDAATSPIAFGASDTMASHSGWTEVTDYSETTREVLNLDAVSGQSVSNPTNKASFSINGTANVEGAFITTVNTKAGTTGVLMSAGQFTGGAKSVSNGDTLNVTVTLTASAS